jgi:ATP-dependent Clp protease ATP-binding subunit ClpX
MASPQQNEPHKNATIDPSQIFAQLNREVIGQDAALREMAVAMYKHLISHAVGNVLMIGNSGTGKTTVMRSVERFLVENHGYERFSTIIRINANLVADLAMRGAQTNVVMDRLARQAANYLKERASLETMTEYTSHGIVCVDEVDKIRSVVGGEPNVKGIVAQDSLLTLMENENVQVNMPYFEKGEWKQTMVPINTRHILFVAGGAFEDLYTQVYERVTEKHGLSNLMKLVPRADGTLERRVVFRMGDHMSYADLFKYGMTPQFIARFNSIIMLGDLTAPDLVKIFKDIPNAIWPTAQDFFKNLNITLDMTDTAMRLLADRAADNNRLGARALHEVFGKIIKRFEYDPAASGLIQEGEGRRVLLITDDIIRQAF